MLSVGPINSEAHVVTSSILRFNPSAQTFEGAHTSKICVYTFIEVSVFTTEKKVGPMATWRNPATAADPNSCPGMEPAGASRGHGHPMQIFFLITPVLCGFDNKFG